MEPQVVQLTAPKGAPPKVRKPLFCSDDDSTFMLDVFCNLCIVCGGSRASRDAESIFREMRVAELRSCGDAAPRLVRAEWILMTEKQRQPYYEKEAEEDRKYRELLERYNKTQANPQDRQWGSEEFARKIFAHVRAGELMNENRKLSKQDAITAAKGEWTNLADEKKALYLEQAGTIAALAANFDSDAYYNVFDE